MFVGFGSFCRCCVLPVHSIREVFLQQAVLFCGADSYFFHHRGTDAAQTVIRKVVQRAGAGFSGLEVARAPYPGAVNIPLSELRERVEELPQNQELLVFCQSGVRGHTATALLNNLNFRAHHLSGGYLTLSR